MFVNVTLQMCGTSVLWSDKLLNTVKMAVVSKTCMKCKLLSVPEKLDFINKVNATPDVPDIYCWRT